MNPIFIIKKYQSPLRASFSFNPVNSEVPAAEAAAESDLHGLQSMSVVRCSSGATLLFCFFFSSLLFREAEDRVPGVKHCFFIRSSVVHKSPLSCSWSCSLSDLFPSASFTLHGEQRTVSLQRLVEEQRHNAT